MFHLPSRDLAGRIGAAQEQQAKLRERSFENAFRDRDFPLRDQNVYAAAVETKRRTPEVATSVSTTKGAPHAFDIPQPRGIGQNPEFYRYARAFTNALASGPFAIGSEMNPTKEAG